MANGSEGEAVVDGRYRTLPVDKSGANADGLLTRLRRWYHD